VARSPDYQRDGISLFIGDCRDVLPDLVGVDVVITDPPYGVRLGEKANNQRFDRATYESFVDTPEAVTQLAQDCLPLMKLCAKRIAMTPGVKNMWAWGKPDHVGSFYYPASSGCNSWGFSCWQPIFFYGKDPFGGKGSRPDSISSTEAAEKNGHPCPKPIGQMTWLVERASMTGDLVCDPFTGSGTTAIACIATARRFVGIEMEKSYFDIAVKRIDAALDTDRDSLWTAKQLAEQQRPLFE